MATATINLEWTKKVEDGVTSYLASFEDKEFVVEKKGEKMFALYVGERAVKLGSLKDCRDEAEKILSEEPEDTTEESAEETPKPKKSKKSKETAAEAAPESKKPEKLKVARTDVDSFGSRLGTRAAAINAVLSTQPQKLKEITEKSGQNAVPAHLRKLRAEGKVALGPDGYYIPTEESPKPKAKKKKKS